LGLATNKKAGRKTTLFLGTWSHLSTTFRLEVEETDLRLSLASICQPMVTGRLGAEQIGMEIGKPRRYDYYSYMGRSRKEEPEMSNESAVAQNIDKKGHCPVGRLEGNPKIGK
jgi:hypothetical protein